MKSISMTLAKDVSVYATVEVEVADALLDDPAALGAALIEAAEAANENGDASFDPELACPEWDDNLRIVDATVDHSQVVAEGVQVSANLLGVGAALRDFFHSTKNGSLDDLIHECVDCKVLDVSEVAEAKKRLRDALAPPWVSSAERLPDPQTEVIGLLASGARVFGRAVEVLRWHTISQGMAEDAGTVVFAEYHPESDRYVEWPDSWGRTGIVSWMQVPGVGES